MSLLLLALVLVSCLADDTIPNIDPYEVLGVPRTATQSEIRSAYKKLALQYHPDKNQGEDTSDIFSSINAAYDILGNPDKRSVFDDFGGSNTGHTGFYSYWEYQQSNTQADSDFYIGDPYITRLTAELWDRRIQGKGVWLVQFYATWCFHCQQGVKAVKSAAGQLDGIAEVGAFNCHKDNNFCQQFGITEYPTFMLISPELQFQHKLPLNSGDLEAQLLDFASSRAAEWHKLAIQSALIPLSPSSFEEELETSDEFWIVVFMGGSGAAKSRSYGARANLVRLSANLRGLANTGIVECDAENFEFCQGEFPEKGIHYGMFPLFRGYPRGPKKKKYSEEIFIFDETPVHVACGIIEKMVRLLMAHERVCQDGECTAVAQSFEEGYEEYEEEVEEQQERGYQDTGSHKPVERRTIEGRRPTNMLGRGQ